MTNIEAFNKFFNNPPFEDTNCSYPCNRTPCVLCEWWNREYTGPIKEESKPFKIFITPPMGVTRAIIDLNMK